MKHIFITIVISFIVLFIGCQSISTSKPPIADVVWKDCGKVQEKTEYDRFFQNGDAEQKLELAGQVSTILEELSVSRERFVDTASGVDSFGGIYFHTTVLAFEKALKSESKSPAILLEMIISFYDSYRINRTAFDEKGVSAVETHWQKYFSKAVTSLDGNKSDAEIFEYYEDMMLAGLNAHSLYDIPRFLRQMKRDRKYSLGLMKTEFDRLEVVFAESTKRSLEDLRVALAKKGHTDKTVQFMSGPSYVVYARKRSWELGMGNEELPTTRPQPRLEHDSNSRKFFPAKLLSRGLCK